MAKSSFLKDKLKQYPMISMVALIIVCLAAIKLSGNQKPEYFEKEGVLSNANYIEPSQDAKAIERLLDGNQQGIVSFEMYIPQKKQEAAPELSRAEIIERIITTVSNIKDDVKIQNTIINMITALDFKLGGSELAAILKSSNIKDNFYYANIIKRIAPNLEYPMSERQMKAIVEPVKDDYYRHKLYDELVKQQLINK